ncbi:MAG: winged helix-turn-helix domain-containing protein [Ilumatobacteraceae bacterium]
MSSNHPLPDYKLEELRVVTSRKELTAMFHPLRSVMLDLVLERAATVKELAVAVKRPPSTVAYHVGVLRDAGLLQVVRTRKVRSIDERFYGRAARIFSVGQIQSEHLGTISNALVEAASESGPAHQADDLRAILRHARIAHERAAEFWEAVLDLVRQFSSLPRAGDTTYAFVAGLYPSDHPSLPPATDQSTQPEST